MAGNFEEFTCFKACKTEKATFESQQQILKGPHQTERINVLKHKAGKTRIQPIRSRNRRGSMPGSDPGIFHPCVYSQ